ncbi:metal-binding regulatory protein cuf1 [Rhizoctonia solani AG-3 Rhs1AP]|uniref:Metal-binding regulatory protein cuf1 n=1 Tax=Rhizoctonia solani AG-3 Rhs1AP TaxID=1086054 RepID=X8JCS3_9AGAM|nr:metal-binding regulatory protein cuf1 [Rhizoctonia solani AG-3 Rhs1AP]
MIFVNDKKYACETCIKGHRSSSCQHTDRALFEIKKKGRPVTQCDHCRELRKTKQVHVRCSCDTKPENAPLSKLPGKKGSRLPAEAAYPHGLSPTLSGVATSPAPSKSNQTLNQTASTDKCVCGQGQSCHCCVPRKPKSHSHSHSQSSSGHTPPPAHTPSNPHPHHSHPHAHAYAPYTRPAVRLSTDQQLQSHSQIQTMYRLGACACGTTCQCPECAQHRRLPHNHTSNPAHTSPNQPYQGHGGDPCPVRCGNCFDCAGGLTLLLDPGQASVQSLESDSTQYSNSSNPSFVYSQTLGPGYNPNGNGYSPTGTNNFNPSPNSTPNGSGYLAPAANPATADVEMDEFNAAMAGLDAGIAAESNSSPAPACQCPPGRCACPGHQHGDASGFWDRPRCGFAVSTERGGCCPSPGMHDMASDVGSEIGIGIGSDGGFVGSDAGIGSDTGSVAGVGSTNLSVDFADLDFGGLALPPMAYDQRFSGEYVYAEGAYRDSGHFSHPRDSGQFSHHRESSQFSNHSNLSLPSSIDSASISLASLASSHGISSLASSHGIPSLASSHGIISPQHSPLSGRITPNRGSSGRVTPVRGMPPSSLGQMQNGKIRAYRRILPKVAATVQNHRPFRRHHQPQPSLHAVMEGDANPPVGTTPPPSQVLLQPGQGQQRIRPSVRSHLPIVGKYFAPGARFEPSRFRNAAAAQAAQAQLQAQLQAQQQAQAQAYQQQLKGQPLSQEAVYAVQEAAYAASLEGYAASQDGSYDGSYASSQPPASPYSQGFSPQEQPLGSFSEEEEDLMYEEEEKARLEAANGYGFQDAMGQFGGAEPGPVYLQPQEQEQDVRLQVQQQDVRLQVQQDMRLQVQQDMRLQVQQDVRLQAQQDARLQAQQDARLQAQQEVRLQAQQDVRLQVQQMQQPQQIQQPQPMQPPPSQHSSPTHTIHPSPASSSLPAHAQMVAGFAHAPVPYIPTTTPYDPRPQLPLQHSSSTATGIMVDPAMVEAPPSPKKVSSGVPMSHTMSLPMSRTPFDDAMPRLTTHAYDDADVKPEGGIKEISHGQGTGKKSRWPSFSVHGHRVMVGAKVMGTAYTQR